MPGREAPSFAGLVPAWRHRIEFRILFLAIALPLAGVLAVSLGALSLLRSSLVESARRQAESTAAVIAGDIRRSMRAGRTEEVRELLHELRATPGIESIAVINADGAEAFSPGAAPTEREVIARLRREGGALAEARGDLLVIHHPLANGPECQRCHAAAGPLLGAAKVSITLAETLRQGAGLVRAALLWSLAGVMAMGAVTWFAIRRLVARPVRGLREAALAIADGNLTALPRVAGRDEIAALGAGLGAATDVIARVIGRIHEVSRRVAEASARTEEESAQVVRATTVESASFDAITASMEELNASIGEISGDLEKIGGAAESLHATSRETAASTAEVLRRTEELVASVGETSATVNGISHTIREISWGSTQLSTVSQQTLDAAAVVDRTIRTVEERAGVSARRSAQVQREAEELGVAAVRRTLDGMERVRAAVQASAAAIESLDGRSRQIGEILEVITEVNEQTSLLALNAAILAAQAGEHGAGFTVVAEEIRSLSVRTARSTVEIAEVIRSVQADVRDAVAAMKVGGERVEAGLVFAREAETTLRGILESARVAAEQSGLILEATGEQAASLATVREAMARLDQMAQFLATGTAEEQREAEGVRQAVGRIVEAVEHIRAANEEQGAAGRHLAGAAEGVAAGVQRMARALGRERDGSAHLHEALVRVLDVPRQNRALALRINQALRRISGETDLLRAEVERFRVAPGRGAGLRFGVVPLERPAEMHRRFTPLVRYLGQALGQPVDLVVALDFAEAVDDLVSGRTNAAFMTPSTWVRARLRSPAVALVAAALRQGKPFHHAVIVARLAAGIGGLAALRGKTFAFGDRQSTSGHIVPRAMLLDAGVALEHFADAAFLGRHDAVAAAVLKGEYDAGALMASVAARYAAAGLAVVAESPPIPEFAVCAGPGLGAETREALRGALLRLSGGGAVAAEVLAAIDRDYTGFAEAEASPYDAILAMMERLNLLREDSS